MSNSRLLSSRYSDNEEEEEEEFTMSPVRDQDDNQQVRYLNNSYAQRQRPYIQTTDTSSQGEDDEEEEEDMEAPPSLILDRTAFNQQHEQRQHQQNRGLPIPITATNTTSKSTREHVTTYDRTMWRWANVENMDDFFNRVYEYFQGKGIYCILLARFLNLL
jgi:hypothetical protein